MQKFSYLKKDEYETWAMKMEYWIMNSDHNLWNIILNGNSRKKTRRDPKGNIMILHPISVEEHIAVQRETKARTILLQSLPEDHMADFHHLDDARDIWLAVKARFGGNDESKKMRKSMLKQEFSEFRILKIKAGRKMSLITRMLPGKLEKLNDHGGLNLRSLRQGGHGSLVWSDQQQWHIRSWRLFPFSNVHVLETISGKVVYMFADGSYPLSVQLMKKMLKHKLEIEIDGVGNDMTYAEQLIQFIKNQIAASIPSA
ncbi:hypothetical protein Tco_0091175 [Tanacetum coccineum]